MNEYEDIWYSSADGLCLYARDYQSSAPASGKRPVVLCMHGLTRNSADFEGISRVLANNYRVIAVDQRGRGLSAYDSNAENYNPMVYVQDMFSLLESEGIAKVILLGTSLGGIMAMMMTAMKPELVQAVIINDIGPEVSKKGLDRLQGYVGKSTPVTDWEEAARQSAAINGNAFPDASDKDWQQFARRTYREDRAGCLRLAYDPKISLAFNNTESNSAAPDLWPVYDQIIDTPMLLIRGELSDILDLKCVAKMQQKKPNLAVSKIPNVGHAPMLSEPIAQAAIEDFLRQFTV